MTPILKHILRIADYILLPLAIPAALILKLVRRAGVQRLPACKRALLGIGVFPIRKHYNEPQFDNRNAKPAFSNDRTLTGIDWNIEGQLKMLEQCRFADELAGLPRNKPSATEFYLDNGNFEPGDAEYWYQIIRALKPSRIFEIGSGFSTLMAVKALGKNKSDDSSYGCEHVCIEPYEQPWLEELEVRVIREKAENLPIGFFSALEAGDVLFIDSSHIIRPQGDVLFEYLELLPTLNIGVVVHVHDIFSPKNYPDQWLVEEIRFWNEQYLFEAFLSHNTSWQIIGALNYLHHHYHDRLKQVAPDLAADGSPGSFYIQRIG